MCEFSDIACFILENSGKMPVSRSRLIKTIYLADWRAAIVQGSQITNADWVLSECGPYSPEIRQELTDNTTNFEIEACEIHDRMMNVVKLKKLTGLRSFGQKDEVVTSFLRKKALRLDWGHFNQLVNSTFPVRVSLVGDKLDLADMAQKYKDYLGEQRAKALLVA